MEIINLSNHIKYCFVILHYMSYEDTVECMESIEQLYKSEDYHVVIVDNGSNNGSGELILEKYKKIKNITVLLQEKNLGFARGNNVGYLWAKTYLDPQFIIVINNDIIFIQDDFLDLVSDIYVKEKYDVLGPDIIDLSRTKHQNPMRKSPLSIKEIKSIIIGKKIYLNAQKKSFVWKIIMAIFVLINPNKPQKIDYKNIQMSCVLQGSCLIFSTNYISNYDEAFLPNTFLYFEEDILRYRMDHDGKKVMYSPELKVVHKEDKSTDMIVKSSKEKNIFKAKYMIESGEIFLDLIKNNEV